jgi:hypothetical protein
MDMPPETPTLPGNTENFGNFVNGFRIKIFFGLIGFKWVESGLNDAGWAGIQSNRVTTDVERWSVERRRRAVSHGIKIYFFWLYQALLGLTGLNRREPVGALERWSVEALGCGMGQIAMFFDSAKFGVLDCSYFSY